MKGKKNVWELMVVDIGRDSLAVGRNGGGCGDGSGDGDGSGGRFGKGGVAYEKGTVSPDLMAGVLRLHLGNTRLRNGQDTPLPLTPSSQFHPTSVIYTRILIS